MSKEQRRRLIAAHWVSNGQLGAKERWKRQKDWSRMMAPDGTVWHTLSEALDAQQSLEQYVSGMFRSRKECEDTDSDSEEDSES